MWSSLLLIGFWFKLGSRSYELVCFLMWKLLWYVSCIETNNNLLIPSAKCRQEANLRICKFPEHDFVPVGTLTLIQAATVCQGLRPYYCATSKKGFRPVAEIWFGLQLYMFAFIIRVWVSSCTKWKFMLWNSGSHQMKRSILFFYKKVHKTVPPPLPTRNKAVWRLDFL